ncbi:MAG: flagellar hook capping FlgD N-terminal domain-containing protein [bacterium]
MQIEGIDALPVYDPREKFAKTYGSDRLGKEEFLKLLITELKNQDPTSPMTDREFIAQLAQFSALEQMTNLNASFQRNQAAELLGHIVDVKNPDTNEIVDSGLVTSMRSEGSKTYVTVNGNEYEVDDVERVSTETQQSQQVLAIGMIGRTVEAIVPITDDKGVPLLDENDKPITETVTGTVKRVTFSGGLAYVVVDDGKGGERSIYVGSIREVS